MECERCDELVSAYEHAVSLYTTAQRKLQGLVGDEFRLAWKELKRFREACKAADEALLAHWREKHTDLAEKARSARASPTGIG